MAAKPLRLLNDSPYVGESLSSFLERTAQYYCAPFKALLAQLMEGHGWDAKGRPDIDFNPPNSVLSRLANSVQDWRSPLVEHRGFHGWVMAPGRRFAYCPICFGEDLAAGRTPYFRMDWAATYVTVCWEHGAPLLEWKDRSYEGRRRLPQDWIHRERSEKVTRPAFFTEHHRLLGRQLERKRGEKRGTSADIFDYLYGLQVAVEKRSAEPMVIYPQGQDPRGNMRAIVRKLVRAVAGGKHEFSAMFKEFCTLSEDYAWLVPDEYGNRRRSQDNRINAIRQTATLEWRRAYLLIAARTLAGSKRYGRAIVTDPTEERPWRELWSESLWRGAKIYLDSSPEHLTVESGSHLDESAPLGHEFDVCSGNGRMRPTYDRTRSWLDEHVLDATS